MKVNKLAVVSLALALAVSSGAANASYKEQDRSYAAYKKQKVENKERSMFDFGLVHIESGKFKGTQGGLVANYVYDRNEELGFELMLQTSEPADLSHVAANYRIDLGNKGIYLKPMFGAFYAQIEGDALVEHKSDSDTFAGVSFGRFSKKSQYDFEVYARYYNFRAEDKMDETLFGLKGNYHLTKKSFIGMKYENWADMNLFSLHVGYKF